MVTPLLNMYVGTSVLPPCPPSPRGPIRIHLYSSSFLLPQAAAADGAFAEEADIERREGKKKRKEGKKLDLLEEVLWQKFPPPSQIGSESFFFSSAFLWGRREEGWSCAYGRNGRRQRGGYIWDTEGWHPFLSSGGGGQF